MIPPKVLAFRRRTISQVELARMIGVNPATIVSLEAGKPARVSTLRAYLAALGCELEIRVKRGPAFLDADEGLEKPLKRFPGHR